MALFDEGSGERAVAPARSAVFAARRTTARIVRGSIDCVLKRADGSIEVLEFKTRPPTPAHQTQLDIYCRRGAGALSRHGRSRAA